MQLGRKILKFKNVSSKLNLSIENFAFLDNSEIEERR